MQAAKPDMSAQQDAIHAVYCRLFAAKDSFPRRTLRVVMSELLYADECAWLVVGITQAALAQYRSGKRSGFERAHLTNRRDMVNHLFDTDAPFSKADLFAYWSAADRTVIALRSENRSENLGAWIPLDNADGRLFRRKSIGYAFNEEIEGRHLRGLAVDTAIQRR